MVDFQTFLWTLVVLVLLACAWWYASTPKNLPPGPLGYPFIGSGLRVLDGANLSKQLFEWKQRYGSIFSFYVMEKLVICFADYESAYEAMVKQAHAFSGKMQQTKFTWFLATAQQSNSKTRKGFVNAEGEDVKNEKRFLMASLRNLGFGKSSIEPNLHKEIDCILTHIQNASETKQMECMAGGFFNMLGIFVVGQRFDYEDKVLQQIIHTNRVRVEGIKRKMLSPLMLSQWLASFAQFFVKKKHNEFMLNLRENFKTFIFHAVRNFETDTNQEITNLVEAYLQDSMGFKKGQPVDENALDEVFFARVIPVFNAGLSTVRVLYAVLFYLAKHPDKQQLMYEEIRDNLGLSTTYSYADRTRTPYTFAAILEAERLMVRIIHPRRVTTNCKVFGYDIPEDSVFITLSAALANNPEVYPKPREFKPERFIGKSSKSPEMENHMAFSMGKRACPGETLGQMMLYLFITHFLTRFELSFPEGQETPEGTLENDFYFGPFPLSLKDRSDQ